MKPEDNQIRRRIEILLTLFFAPLAVALAANIATNIGVAQPVPSWLYGVSLFFAGLAIFLGVLVYTHKFDDLLAWTTKKIRARKFRKPRVLILDGTLDGDSQEKYPAPQQSNKAPTEWQNALERFGWRVEVEPVRGIQQAPLPDIVVNPFGELYPEAHSVLHSTAFTIREYVRKGGIYVNVAGKPFWYRYDPRAEANMETAGWMRRKLEDAEGSFDWKPLFEDLFPDLNTTGGDPEVTECLQSQEDLERFGNIMDAGGSRTVTKFRSYPASSGQMIPLLRDRTQELHIIGSLPFGKGSFLFAGVCIDDEAPSFEKVVVAIKGWADYEARGRKP